MRHVALHQAGPLRLDGLLGSELPGVIAAGDVPVGPLERARSLAGRVPPRAVVMLASAAWIHRGGPAPECLELAVPTPSRRRFGGVRTHCVRHRVEDIVQIGPLRVTSPLATAADLARYAGDDEDHLHHRRRAALTGLLDSGLTVAEVVEAIAAQPRRARSRRATALLRRLGEGPDQTG